MHHPQSLFHLSSSFMVFQNFVIHGGRLWYHWYNKVISWLLRLATNFWIIWMLASSGTNVITRKTREVAMSFNLLQTGRHASRKSALFSRSPTMAFVNSSGMESIVLEMDEKLVKTCHFRCGTARDRPLEQSRINKKICGTDNSATRFSSRLVM